jgi:hypothetical protein
VANVYREWQVGEPGTKSRARRERRRLPGRIAGWCVIGALCLSVLASAFAPVACWVPWLDLNPQRREARAWLRTHLDYPRWSELEWTEMGDSPYRLRARFYGPWGSASVDTWRFGPDKKGRFAGVKEQEPSTWEWVTPW